MCPRSEPSCSSTAQPRPLAVSPSSSPSQLNSTHGRPSRRPWAQSIQPSTAMNRKLPVWSAWNSMKAGPMRSIASRSQETEIAAEAALDGLYVLRTSVAASRLDAPSDVRAYKLLTRVERAFRAFKALALAVRPIHHYAEPRVRAHILLCLLAYYVQWHLERAWAPLLFRDEERPELADPVAPAQRSEAALRKAHTQQLPDGTPVHSFRTLLAELATLTRNRVVPLGAPDEAAFEIVATPTPLQARALALLNLTPVSA